MSKLKVSMSLLLITLLVVSVFAMGCPPPPAAPGPEVPVPPPAPIKWTIQMHGPAAHPAFRLHQQWANDVNVASGGRLQITVHPVGTLFPLMEVFPAVSRGALDGAIMWGPFWRGIRPALALSCGQTSGLNAFEFTTWLHNYGGWELIKELYAQYNIHWMPSIPMPPETFLWAHKPIRTLDDLEGLKVRAAGFSLVTFTKLGIAATFIPGGETPPALMKGVVDAAEFGALMQDKAVGFHEAARYAMIGARAPVIYDDLMINMDRWNELPLELQEIVTSTMLRHIETGHGELLLLDKLALQLLKEKGITFVQVSDELIDTFRTTLDGILDEEAAKDPDFAKIWESLKTFRTEFRQFMETLYPWE
ncbi:MAG: Monocarboxylate 2-oxoacid-binding periplasmic protein [Chloroflexi bacterium]|nr:Monocarboxylate 2-oxoacid-binding periplasmic protein [Chloroflexota bacterium]